ncbi:transglycosylase domain-containing protein [Tessaracoccus sp. ZS01]|uniref:transglycosylase domain-containing protein n=1 Tax=Tessaracoccus sp. ZS01 TaxID=1906324 RepID=UPI0009700432|nr:transglycosylase domain-containing protein [Tessaracoccus sp. ZS01]OMG53460.1 penicillin-binding protein [Tessaracoccus sp. ZS01]
MKSASLGQKGYSLLMFFAVSLLSGLLLAGLAVPMTALAGNGVKMAAESLEQLPAEFETPPQSERSRVLMGDGKVLATFFDENRIYVPLEDISLFMQQAQIAIEDHRFYEHGAIDFQGFGRAAVKTLTGDTQGASTLTQQYVKLVRVETASMNNDQEGVRKATEVSLERKIVEMRYAMAVEEKLTKDEILERYLNIAYYGDGAYGVEAAAQHYFQVSAKDLDLAQSAMLAGLVQNPVQTNPTKYTQRAINRRDTVLNRMAELKLVTKAEAAAAKETTFDPSKIKRLPNGCVASQFPFLCDYVQRTLMKMPSMGETEEERRNMLNRGGLTIHTLIDAEAQLAAEAAVASQIAPLDPVWGSSVLVQPSTGLIVAMAQSRPKMGPDEAVGETFKNINVEGSMGGIEGFQAGSTFKAFTMAAALDLGMTPDQKYDAPKELEIDGETFTNCEGPFKTRADRPVSNYDRGYGTIDMRKAAESSVNTYFMQLIQAVGICNTTTMAEKVGVKLANGDPMSTQASFPSFTLGTAYITPLSMAEAYATFANRGIHCTPIILQSVTTKEGKKLEVPSANCEQVIRPEIADGVNYLLQGVAMNGTGRRAALRDGRDEAGKTGTTNENKAVWYAGYTPEMAGVAMIGVDTANTWWKTHTQTVKGTMPASGTYLEGSGGGDAGQIWKAAMTSALADKPKTKFTEPTKTILEGQLVPVPDVKGMGYNEAKETIEAAGFTTRTQREYSSRRKGAFLGITPSDQAVKFSTITLRVSAGPEPAPKPAPEPVVTEPAATAPAAPAAPAAPPATPPGQQPGGPPGQGGDDDD